MKIILFLSAIFCACNSTYSQKIDHVSILPEKDSIVLYSEVVMVDSSISKNELFLRCQQWFARTYKSSRDVIQVEDKESGQITGKGLLKTIYNMGMLQQAEVSVSHLVRIYVKDGRYKYEITDLSGRYYSKGYSIGTSYISGSWQEFIIDNNVYRINKKNYIKMLQDVDAQIKLLIANLKQAMNQPAKKEENW